MIGAVLRGKLRPSRSGLRPGDFQRSLWRETFRAAEYLEKRTGRPPNLAALSDYLGRFWPATLSQRDAAEELLWAREESERTIAGIQDASFAAGYLRRKRVLNDCLSRTMEMMEELRHGKVPKELEGMCDG